jgi:hypothetical protein
LFHSFINITPVAAAHMSNASAILIQALLFAKLMVRFVQAGIAAAGREFHPGADVAVHPLCKRPQRSAETS